MLREPLLQQFSEMDQTQRQASVTSVYASISIEQLCQELQTSVESGLSAKDVMKRRCRYGLNVLEGVKKCSMWKNIIEQCQNPLIALLVVSSGVSLAMGNAEDAVSIAVAITIVVAVALIQEYQSEKTIEALKELVPPKCKVLRDNRVAEMLAQELVPGDVIILTIGDRVPADCRLIQSVNLQVDESSLTGETNPVDKHSTFIPNCHTLPIAERKNSIFMGTLVCAGQSRAIVTGVGYQTELGSIFTIMNSVEERKSLLQQRMDILGKQLSIASMCMIGFIMFLGVIQGRDLLQTLQIGVSLAVAAIPEGLPICVTVTLALGVMRMAKRKAIVKKLPAVEALGCTNVMCIDKTGTITSNEMEVSMYYFPSLQSQCAEVCQTTSSQSSLYIKNDVNSVSELPVLSNIQVYNALLSSVLSCSNGVADNALVGQATESAIVLSAQKLGIVTSTIFNYIKVNEIPFSSDSKWMAVQYEHNSVINWYAKGAFEVIAAKCEYFEMSTGSLIKLDATQVHQINTMYEKLTTQGLRVIAVCYGADILSNSMVFSSLIGIVDPPRPNISKVIAELSMCNIKTVMITGDSKETACYIASQVGILTTPAITTSHEVMSGQELDTLTTNELVSRMQSIRLFYRTRPMHKLKIVQAFQSIKYQVAMTGDGVNDAPALKAADIGIAMGVNGTDVSREASDIILLDDNFQTITFAIQEAKSIYHNIKNFLRFQLSTSIAAILLIAISTLFAFPNPLNAMQILWINIIMDGPPAQSLGVEPSDPDNMHESPRSREISILDMNMMRPILWSVCIMVTGTLIVFYIELGDDGGIVSRRDRTMSFTTFIFFDMFNALSCRSQTKSIFKIGLFSNTAFTISVTASIIGQLLVIYCPFLQTIFQVEALSFVDLLYITGISSSVFIFDELRKLSIYFLQLRMFRSKSDMYV